MNTPAQQFSAPDAATSAPVVSILLVDDHPPNLLALETLLAPLGQRVVHANSGPLALERVLSREFAVVLLQVKMAGMDGFQTARRLQALREGRPLPILFMSTDPLDEQALEDAYALGAADVVTESISPTAVRAKVSVFIDLFQKSELLNIQQTALAASALLSSSLDYQTTLQNMAKLAVPALADWCALDMVLPDGRLERLAVEHQDPAKIAFVRALEERYPSDPNAPTGVPNVIRTGKVEWLGHIPSEMLARGAKDAEHLKLITALGLRSYIAVPISVRGRVLGVLTLVMAESGRTYTEADVERAQNLAAGAGLFVDNSRLFHEATEARKRLETLALELKTSEEKFRSLAETIPQQVWTATPDGGLDFVNDRVPSYFGRPRAELLGNGWASGVHPEDLPASLARWVHCLQTGEPYETEFRLKRGADGQHRWHLARALCVRNDAGRIVKWFGSNTDIDDRKRAQQEREQLIGALERSNADLDQFAYVASHDLKAPLRGIANLSQWIEEDLGDRITEASRKHLGLMRGRVHRLEALIDGILGYSRAGRNPQQTEQVAVKDLVRDIVDILAPPAGITIEADPSLPVVATAKVPLQQVFMNLIGNAVKHGGSTIRVAAKQSGAFWEFSVTDNGPGIAPEYHEKIWGIFQTLQARDKVEGTGIGLAVVRKIVQAVGGRTQIQSSEGNGATFSFTWPR